MNPIAARVKIERTETKLTVQRGPHCTKIIQRIPIPKEISNPNLIESKICKKLIFGDKLVVVNNLC